MKRLILICTMLMAVIFITDELYSQTSSAQEQCKKMARGVNIIGYDNAFWKDYTNGRFKEGYFKMIKEAGFSNIRVNLHTFSHMDSNYVIEPAWLETLDYVVKKGLEANLMVILDMHEYNAMADDPIGKKEMFLSVWRQLAPRYKDQPGEVILKFSMNPIRSLPWICGTITSSRLFILFVKPIPTVP